MKKLGVNDLPVEDDSNHFVGGQSKLEGAPYFWTFTWLMLGTAIVFVVVAYFYKPLILPPSEDDEPQSESEAEGTGA